MFKDKGNKYLLLGITVVFLLSSFLFVSNAKQDKEQNNQTTFVSVKGESNPTQTPTQFSDTEIELDNAATPIVDLDSPINITVDEKRKKKNRRFNNSYLVETKIDPRAGLVSRVPEGYVPDFPFELSDLIIEGKITDSNAFLSEDKTGIYSEFTVLVNEIIKTSPSIQVNKNDSIVTERSGGRVRYSSGQIVRYEIAGLGSPIKNAKYLLFLKKTEDSDNYQILTGYEMRGNKVVALDGWRVSFKGKDNRVKGGNWSYDKHNGKDVQKFKEEVNNALARKNQ